MKPNITIYYIDHKKLTPPSPSDCAAGFLPALFSNLYYGEGGAMKRQGQVLSPKYVMRKYASLLLMHQVLGVSSREELNFGPHGKPALKNQPERFFNISHGRDYSVLAVGDRPLGIDVEEIPVELTEEKRARGLKKRRLVAERSFPTAFRDKYLLANSECEATVFTRLWTNFEAILKAEGTGLSLNLKEHPELLEKWKLQSFSIDDHVVTLALADDFVFEPPIEIPDLST